MGNGNENWILGPKKEREAVAVALQEQICFFSTDFCSARLIATWKFILYVGSKLVSIATKLRKTSVAPPVAIC